MAFGTITRRRAVLAAGGSLAAPSVRAQALYPAGQSVALVVALAPGGASDVIGRVVTQGLQTRLGGTFFLEHRPGGSTSIAARHVARARPDGTTLFLGSISTFTLTPLTMQSPGYDPINDFTHITQACESLFLLAANPRWPSLEALLDAARARPDSISYATWGIGTTSHLWMEDLCRRAGVRMLHVPYAGSPPAMTDTIAGRTDCLPALLAACKGHMEAGRLRGLAVPTATRPPQLPDVPTFIEKGFPDFVSTVWYSVQGPPGMPAPIAARTRDALAEHFAGPAVRAFIATQGMLPPEIGEGRLLARIRRELALHRELMARSGVEPS